MRYYVEAYYEDGREILGNMDGQASIKCRNIRRTKHYRHLRDVIASSNRHPKVAYYKIVDANGHILETLYRT